MDVNLVRVIILCEVYNANVQSNYIRLKNGLKKIRVHLLCGKSHRRNPSKLAAVKIQSSILKNVHYVKALSNSVNNAERYCNIFNVYRFTYFFFTNKYKYGSTNVSPPKTEFLLLRFTQNIMAALKNFVLMDVNKARTLSYPTIDIAIISMTGVVRYSFLMYILCCLGISHSTRSTCVL